MRQGGRELLIRLFIVAENAGKCFAQIFHRIFVILNATDASGLGALAA